MRSLRQLPRGLTAVIAVALVTATHFAVGSTGQSSPEETLLRAARDIRMGAEGSEQQAELARALLEGRLDLNARLSMSEQGDAVVRGGQPLLFSIVSWGPAQGSQQLASLLDRILADPRLDVRARFEQRRGTVGEARARTLLSAVLRSGWGTVDKARFVRKILERSSGAELSEFSDSGRIRSGDSRVLGDLFFVCDQQEVVTALLDAHPDLRVAWITDGRADDVFRNIDSGREARLANGDSDGAKQCEDTYRRFELALWQ